MVPPMVGVEHVCGMKLSVFLLGVLGLLLTAGCGGSNEHNHGYGGAYEGSDSSTNRGGAYGYPYRPYQGYPNYGNYPYQQ